MPGIRGQVEAPLAGVPDYRQALNTLRFRGQSIENWLESGQPDITAGPPKQTLRATAERLIGEGARHVLVRIVHDMGATVRYSRNDSTGLAILATEAMNEAIRTWAQELAMKRLQATVLDWAAAFASAFAWNEVLGITVFD